jgi:hypothetical protein
VSLRTDGETDRDEVKALIREAYRQVALPRTLKALDAGLDSRDRRSGEWY